VLYKDFHRARAEIGRPGLRWHDLRHRRGVGGGDRREFGGIDGAPWAFDVGAGLRYQYVAHGRDREMASLPSKLAEGAPQD
jgi:hypothetical protein